MIDAKFRVYIAVSVDGYIATEDGGVQWLEPFSGEGVDYGYDAFLASIDTIVMGRKSFDQVLGFGKWPYAGKPSIVLTHRAAPRVDIPDINFMKGEIGRLAEDIAGRAKGDIWIMGGADVIRGFLEVGRVDKLEIFVMPVLLGRGTPLFLAADRPRPLKLVKSHSWPEGVIQAVYAPA